MTREQLAKCLQTVFAKSLRGEGVIYLFPAGEKEIVRVNSVGHRATDQRKPVEDDGRFIGVLEQELAQNVEENCEDDESGPSSSEQHPDGLGRALLADTVKDCCEKPHGCTLENGQVQ